MATSSKRFAFPDSAEWVDKLIMKICLGCNKKSLLLRKPSKLRSILASVFLTGSLRLSSCTQKPEWTWPVIKGVRSIGRKPIALIDRIVVLKNRTISSLPHCNAKCPLVHGSAGYSVILATFTWPPSSILTSPSTSELLQETLNPSVSGRSDAMCLSSDS
jgi:hypothetical protein